MQVTSIETMKLASAGNLVSIPGFADGETITVRLRKPNMLTLMKSGRIPNNLFTAATELFDGKGKQDKEYTPEQLLQVCDLMTCFCEASLAEPKYKEMTDAGIELTMEQMMFIFQYAQGGVKALEPFRQEQGNHADTGNIETVEHSSESHDGN